MRFSCAARTDTGIVRSGNEDNYLMLADRGVFVVADGMGGHAAGEVASEMAVRRRLYSRFEVRIEGHRLRATVWGERTDTARHQPAVEVKGATYTNLSVRFDPSGEWIAENTGVAPDVEVELDPKAVREGHDPQLERAVSLAMEELKKHPPAAPNRPPYPDYQHPESRR